MSVSPAPGGISVYFRNVTGLKRRVYEAALSNTPDFVSVIDLEHRLTWANEALVKLWGRGDVRGKRWLELAYEPWHPELHDREIDQVIATRRPIRGEVPFTGTGGRRVYDYIFAPEFGDQPPAHRGRAPRAEARPARRAGLEGDPVQGLLNSLAK